MGRSKPKKRSKKHVEPLICTKVCTIDRNNNLDKQSITFKKKKCEVIEYDSTNESSLEEKIEKDEEKSKKKNILQLGRRLARRNDKKKTKKRIIRRKKNPEETRKKRAYIKRATIPGTEAAESLTRRITKRERMMREVEEFELLRAKQATKSPRMTDILNKICIIRQEEEEDNKEMLKQESQENEGEGVIMEKINPIRLEVGKVFMDKWLILHEKDTDESLPNVTSYLVMDSYGLEGLLRVEPLKSSQCSIISDAFLLEKLSLANKCHLYNVVIEYRMVNETCDNAFLYIVTVYRAGPTMSDCLDLLSATCRLPMSQVSVARIAIDVLAAIESVCKLGFIFCDINIEHFSFDVVSRRFYLHDRRAVFLKCKLDEPMLSEALGYINYGWSGYIEHAPLSWHYNHDDHVMSEIDCLESLFYIIIDLLGLIFWKDMSELEIVNLKSRMKCMNGAELAKNYSYPLAAFWIELRRARTIEMSLSKGKLMKDNLILLNGPRGGARLSTVEYCALHDSLSSMFRFHVNASWDSPYEWEASSTEVKERNQRDERSDLIKWERELAELEADVHGLQLIREYRQRDEAHNMMSNSQNAMDILVYVTTITDKIAKEQAMIANVMNHQQETVKNDEERIEKTEPSEEHQP